GLQAVKALAKTKPPVRVTLLEQHNYHLFQPLLYQLATGLVQPADIAHPVRGIVRRYRRTGVRMATVAGVDFSTREVFGPAEIPKGALTVVVVGRGPTGVEMAGALQELFKHVLVHDFPDLDIDQAK